MTTESKFENWIFNVLSKPDDVFNGLSPCPFAKEAWLKNRVVIHELFDSDQIDHKFLHELDNYSSNWPKSKEVIAIVCDPKFINSERLTEITEIAIQKFLVERGYVALEDHPETVEKVENIVLNNGEYAIIFLQPLDKLKNARKILERKGYYKNWTKDYYYDVVGNQL